MSVEIPSQAKLKIHEDGRLTRFASPPDWVSRLRNLGYHVYFLATEWAYQLNPPHPNRAAAAQKKLIDGHIRGLARLYALLDPNEDSVSWDQPADQRRSAQAFINGWLEIVAAGKGDGQQIKAAIEAAESLIVRCPVATSCYLAECSDVMSAGEMLTFAGRALLNVACDADRTSLAAILRVAEGKAAAELSPQLRVASKSNPGNKRRAKADLVLTKSQGVLFDRLVALGQLHFSGKGHGHALRSRTYPLLAAPSGCGKTFLLRAIADTLNAKFLRFTRGDWTVQHARSGTPTLFLILDELATTLPDGTPQRLVVSVDECDKLQGLVGATGSPGAAVHEWTACLANELFGAIDGIFPLGAWGLEFSKRNPGKVMPADIESRIAGNLWWIACGTWQDLFDSKADAKAMGFGASPTEHVTPDAVAAARVIPPEFSLRFRTMVMTYPNRDETAELLDRFGLTRLASDVGELLDPAAVDWRKGGMRALETIQTDLLIRKFGTELGRQPGTGQSPIVSAAHRQRKASACYRDDRS